MELHLTIICHVLLKKNVVVVNKVAADLLKNMGKNGSFVVSNSQDIEKIKKLTVTEKYTPNKKICGKIG